MKYEKGGAEPGPAPPCGETLPKKLHLVPRAARAAGSSQKRNLSQLGLGQFDDGGEVGLFADGEISQHLAVDFHTGKLQTVDGNRTGR